MASETVVSNVAHSDAKAPATPARSPAYEAYLRSLKRRTYAIQAWQVGLLVVFMIL